MTSKRYTGNIITDTPTEPTGNAAGGVWSLAEANAYKGVNAWPTLPEAPTIGTATAGIGDATVAFTAGELYGGTGSFTATSSPSGITGTGSSSPITVSGLTNGVSYTFTVKVQTGAGTSAESASSNSVTPEAPSIVLFGGGLSFANVNNIQEIDVSSTGNATDFGDLTVARRSTGSAGNSTVSMWAGGRVSSFVNTIDKVNPQSSGNASDYGDLIGQINRHVGLSNSSRAIFSGGDDYYNGRLNTMDYKTISSSGNTSDYGDLTEAAWYPQATSSPTRGVIALVYTSSNSNVINYCTIASTGNASDFGDLSGGGGGALGAATSSSTRGIFFAPYSSFANRIDYLTIASLGNTVDFGDLTKSNGEETGGAGSNNTRAVYGVASNNVASQSNIQYITIASTGNATNFGDFNLRVYNVACCSANHGGLQ